MSRTDGEGVPFKGLLSLDSTSISVSFPAAVHSGSRCAWILRRATQPCSHLAEAHPPPTPHHPPFTPPHCTALEPWRPYCLVQLVCNPLYQASATGMGRSLGRVPRIRGVDPQRLELSPWERVPWLEETDAQAFSDNQRCGEWKRQWDKRETEFLAPDV